ncbi:hypothetical protein QUB63_13605 [Microcoleus sp. ARI1-B5]|uniref:hypothetical protein n=1 Tax=unclassified Microcoleus TaxID=2642155 RepID=UPI002FD29DF5
MGIGKKVIGNWELVIGNWEKGNWRVPYETRSQPYLIWLKKAIFGRSPIEF